MEYKNIDLELPPLGEIVVRSEIYNIIDYTGTEKKAKRNEIGFFYKGKEETREFLVMKVIAHRYIEETEEKACKWSYLPKFNRFDQRTPPVGEKIIMQYKGKENEEKNFSFSEDCCDWCFCSFVLLNGKDLTDFQDRMWISFSAFNEDK